MPGERRFLLDADVLIQAHRSYYAFDLCPGYWDALATAGRRVATIDKVREELRRGNEDDPLRLWLEARAAAFIASTDDEETKRWVGEAFAWVRGNPQYLPVAEKVFSESADGWLVAHAKAARWVVVTRERPAPASKREVKVPDVCQQFGVECIDTFAMLRELGVRFVLPPQP